MSVLDRLRRQRRRLQSLDRLAELDRLREISGLRAEVELVREAVGRMEARSLRDVRGTLRDHEFRVYSHAGEDGIIQFLVNALPITSRSFVEFGVEDYQEANTRFLLVHDGWRGLVMDGSQHHIAQIRAHPLFWNWDLKAEAAFVTRENVNSLLDSHGFAGDLGLLSVDVDGNDYWIFEAIEVVRPAVAVVEYNHRFGPSRSVTIPYDAAFVRRQDDSSYIASGASLSAIVRAAERKGLAFVGCNSFGNNAFFVRDELRPDWLPKVSAEEGFVAGRFREPLRVGGVLTYLTAQEERQRIAEANLVEVQ